MNKEIVQDASLIYSAAILTNGRSVIIKTEYNIKKPGTTIGSIMIG